MGAVGVCAIAMCWPLALSRDPSHALPGLRIDGVPVAPGQSVRALVQQRAEALEGRRVRLVVAGGAGVHPVLEATLGELGVLYEGSPHLRNHGMWQTSYMFDLGLIIGGGTAQIQKNTISERGLGMPREPKPAKV